jgi:hypothetical protein
MDSRTLIVLAPLLFVSVFALMWFGIAALLAHMSGWPALAERFRSIETPEGERFRFASGSVGATPPVNYRNCLFLIVGERGFALSLLFMFRFHAPQLFVPWSEVETVAEQKTWIFPHVQVAIRNTKTRLNIFGAAGSAIRQSYERYAARNVRESSGQVTHREPQ